MAEDQQSNKLKMHSPDLTEANIDKLAELFPNCVTEAQDENGNPKRAIDFDQLRQELSDHVVDGPRERYQLNWPGKREALLAANAPIAKTLRPCRDESVDFDTTRNLFIEGDNLDALKLLQETYLNKVKMIYIDPPYNTGNDFIYDDDFAESSAGYLHRSSQVDDEENRLVASRSTGGRFHSDWLSMMYPRLRLARNLLREDGVILISIDDGEIHNLRKLCDEIFDSNSFIAQFVWKARQFTDARAKTNVSTDHEYIVAYSKTGGFSLRGVERDESKFSNPDDDARGDWMSRSILGLATQDQRPNLHYEIIESGTGRVFQPNPSTGWRYSKDRMYELIEDGRIIFPKKEDGRPREKKFRSEMSSEFVGFRSIIEDVHTANGTREIRSLFGSNIFPFPKPSVLLAKLVNQVTSEDDIVLDLFAGTATTAHSVMDVNAADGGKRKFIMVQLDEFCEEKSEAFKSGFQSISEVGRERIRRAGVKIKNDVALSSAKLDVGFRFARIDTSNMKDVYYAPDAIAQDGLFGQIENIKEDRTDEDLLFQILLDWGVDLSLSIQSEKIAGKTVYFVDENALAACFEMGIDEDFVKTLAERKPLRAVFRDSGYGNDSTKINVEQIFKLISPATEVKTL